MLSVNGNEQSFQMNNLSVVYGKVAFDASGSFDRNEDLKNRNLLPKLINFIENKKTIKFEYHPIHNKTS